MAMCPAVDWFFVIPPTPPQNQVTVWPIALWATLDRGGIAGMVSAPQIGQRNEGLPPTLVFAPPVDGVYKHLRELNESERKALETGNPVAVNVTE